MPSQIKYQFSFCRYPYTALILNFSQSWALYCLVQFYGITKDELAHIKPLAKFLTFKSIVFLTWWQGVAISLLSTLGLFKSPIAQQLQFKTSVQDFIICIEVINLFQCIFLLILVSFITLKICHYLWILYYSNYFIIVNYNMHLVFDAMISPNAKWMIDVIACGTCW